jgi:predicted anti-sigma-YlaC factor YlaD
MIRCDEVQTQGTALLDGELTPEAASAIEAHLAVCAACSESYHKMRTALELAKAWQVEGGDVLVAVQQQITQDEMHSLRLEMKRLCGEVAALRAEVTELKRQEAHRSTAIGQQTSILRFPYATVRDMTRPII